MKWPVLLAAGLVACAPADGPLQYPGTTPPSVGLAPPSLYSLYQRRKSPPKAVKSAPVQEVESPRRGRVTPPAREESQDIDTDLEEKLDDVQATIDALRRQLRSK